MNLSAIRDRVAASTVRWAPARLYAGALGWGARRTLPRALRAPLYTSFARAVGADLDEVEYPLEDYASFGAFFARGLRSDCRVVDPDPRAVVAPCDGNVGASGIVERGVLIQAKGKCYSLAELLRSQSLASALEGGGYVTIYLSPRDYHRVHTPVAGELAACHHIPGSLFPVNDWFRGAVPGLFARNERAIAQLDTEHGPVVVVLVAAAGVGNVALCDSSGTLASLPRARAPQCWRYHDKLSLDRGDALGAFYLGSTVIAIFAPEGFDLAAPPPGGTLRFGQRLGRVSERAGTGTHGGQDSKRGLGELGGCGIERTT